MSQVGLFKSDLIFKTGFQLNVLFWISGMLDSDILIEYIKARSPIVQAVEGRIMFENGSCNSAAPTILKSNYVFVVTALLGLLVLLLPNRF